MLKLHMREMVHKVKPDQVYACICNTKLSLCSNYECYDPSPCYHNENRGMLSVIPVLFYIVSVKIHSAADN